MAITKWYAPNDGSLDGHILKYGKKDDIVKRVSPDSEELKKQLELKVNAVKVLSAAGKTSAEIVESEPYQYILKQNGKSKADALDALLKEAKIIKMPEIAGVASSLSR